MNKICLVFGFAAFLVSCGGNKESSTVTTSDSVAASIIADTKQQLPEGNGAQMEMPNVNPADISFRVFNNDTTSEKSLKGYGYDILNDGSVYVHQPSIPAISGNRAFSTEADAKKAASLVVDKVKNGILPPTISVEELDSLGIK